MPDVNVAADLAPPITVRQAVAGPYRADIDGLRAVAVLAVVLYHAFPTIVTGGFVGVDVFFVISGFLISRIIFSDLDRGKFRFLVFYGRRIRRIFPALLLMLLACIGYGFVILLPTELAELGKHAAGGAGFVSNLLLWSEAGYFDHEAVAKPLLHLWSLGVEEQFYIFWPLALWILYSIGLRQVVFLAIVTAGSFWLNLSLAATNITADFYSPFARFWELSSGATLAWLTLHPAANLEALRRRWAVSPPMLCDAGSVMGLALILGAACLLDREMRFPGELAVLPIAGALLLIAAGPAALANRLVLSNRVAVFIGLLSYPLYLWHWPLISYAYIVRRGRAPKPLVAAGLIALSIVLAWLTYRLVERPIRFGPRRFGTTLALATAMGVLGVFGAGTWLAGGFAFRYPALPDINITKVNAAISDGYFQPTPHMRVRQIGKTSIAEIGQGEAAVVFVGDSLIYHYGPRVEALFDRGLLKKKVYFVVGASCLPIPGLIRDGYFAQCRDLPVIARDLIDGQHIGTIVLGGLWPESGVQHAFVERAGVRLPLDSAAAIDALYANLADEVQGLVQTGHRVALVLVPPTHEHFDPQGMISRSLTGFSIDPLVLEGVPVVDLTAAAAQTNRRLADIAQRTAAGTISPLVDICGTGPRCSAFFADGEPKFADDKHLRPMFVRDHITVFDDLLTR